MAKAAVKKSSRRSPSVKNWRDVSKTLNGLVFKYAHDRYSVTFSKTTKEKLVAYGPWLAALLLLIISPELLVLAKEAKFVTFSGFIERILFNKADWVLLIVIFTNCLLLVDGLSDLFSKKNRGWQRVYLAVIINIFYVLYQLGAHLDQPAAPLLALFGFGFCLFTVLDIRSYYK